MIEIGRTAPAFTLFDQFRRVVDSRTFLDRANLVVFFYVLDWTPTCSRELAGLERFLPQMRRANTQAVAISVDSLYSHANFGASLGGITLPLLADFEPKGAVARQFGCWLDGGGFADRATVILDRQGVVRWTQSVTPAGERDLFELAEHVLAIDAAQRQGTVLTEGRDLPEDSVLFVDDGCAYSAKVLLALENLRQLGRVQIRNLTRDAAARNELRDAGAQDTPCLRFEGRWLLDQEEIVAAIVERVSPLV